MKLTLSNIKELKRQSDSPLTKRVCNYVIDNWHDYSDKTYIFRDVLEHGCQSGVVSELVWYSQTTIELFLPPCSQFLLPLQNQRPKFGHITISSFYF